MNKILIIGAGNQGFALSAHLAHEGIKVNVWNRTRANISSLITDKKIFASGVINGVVTINNASDNLNEVYLDFIYITTPASAHNSIAKLLAKKVTKKTNIVLSPGRTFGAINFFNKLKEYGCVEVPNIFETQTIIHTCRKQDELGVKIFSLKNDVMISALNSNTMKSIDHFPNCLRQHLKLVKSTIITSLGNVGMILHCAPTLFNAGCIESKRVSFKYYFDGISFSVANFLEKLDNERLIVAENLGFNVEAIIQWLKRSYNTNGHNLYECLQNNQAYENIESPKTLNHRYITEDIPCGLVPLESIAKSMKIDVPLTTLIIDLANCIVNVDFRKSGRLVKLEDLKSELNE